MLRGMVFAILPTVIAIYIVYITRRPVSSLCESFKCPYCYGTSLCPAIDAGKITLRYTSVNDFLYNVLSVKNVYFADYEGTRVILKKLGHQSDLNGFTAPRAGINKNSVLEVIPTPTGSFTSCTREASEKFIEIATRVFSVEEIWTLLHFSVEPLMLILLEDFPVPALYGACGFVVVEQYCGIPLNQVQAFPWTERALLAVRLLEAAIDFTEKHQDFRVYLTDISPDNVVVDDSLNVYFVDLANVILQRKIADDMVHYSEHIPEEDFAYTEAEICASDKSDHNIYAVCRLMLSRMAAWPMMSGGLLHSPPADCDELFDLIEECVFSERQRSRFVLAKELIKLLKYTNT